MNYILLPKSFNLKGYEKIFTYWLCASFNGISRTNLSTTGDKTSYVICS